MLYVMRTKSTKSTMHNVPWFRVLALTVVLPYGVLSLSIPATTLRFQSCPPPRFDAFDERIVGTWWDLQQPSSPSESSSEQRALMVEEVMRSCGGAVQGIREVTAAILDHGAEQGPYLNRADDGFLPRNDGSYSWGPTQLSDEEDGTTQDSFLSCFFLQRNLRLVLSGYNDDLSLVLCRSKTALPWNCTIMPFPEMAKKITWHKHVRCRMPSPSMPFMSQRLRWEEANTDHNVETADDELSFDDSKATNGVLYIERKLSNLPFLMDEWNLRDCWLETNTDDSRIHFCAVGFNGKIQTQCREYTMYGQLVNVVWSQGVLD